MVQQLIDVSFEPQALKARVDNVVNLAKWASETFANFDRSQTLRIVEAVARAGHEHAAKYADWAVKETGFGVAEHKKLKNEGCSLSLFEHYKNMTLSRRVLTRRKKLLRYPALPVLSMPYRQAPIPCAQFILQRLLPC